MSNKTERSWRAFRQYLASLPDEKRRRIQEDSEEWAKSILYSRQKELCTRLVVGVLDFLKEHADQGGLSPWDVAGLLTGLSMCKNSGDLKQVVRAGLRKLNISTWLVSRGKPRGRKADKNKYIEFRAQQVLIERFQLWVKKQRAKEEFANRWRTELRAQLTREGWPEHIKDEVIQARTPRSFALKLASAELGCGYDSVQKAVNRFSKTIPS
jgi:hypothetical protein